VSITRYCIQCGKEYGAEEQACPVDGSPLRARASDDPLIGRVLAERYDILELLGVGGMGRVYVAEHVALGRKSAVKVISPDYANSAEAISRFNREAANASRINHPNVAQVYDFGTTPDGTLYLAMEFIDGEPLSKVIERLGALTVQRAAAITMQVAEGLAAAHHLGIVHRDLKPENIMVGRNSDGSDWVKVVDFGIAKTVESDQGSQTLTTAGVNLGTPEYMSPEQFAGERLDHRTDIYSLGLVVFNMLTGQLPYATVTSKETLVKRLTSKPRPLAEARPQTVWPSGLQTALDRALAPEANDRYHTVTDFGRDVVRVCTRTGGAGVSQARVRAVPAPSEWATPVAATTAQRPRPIVTRSDSRMRVWPAIFVVLLAGVGAGWLVVTHPTEMLQLVGMVAKAVPDTTTRLDASVPVDTLPEVSVIPQGSGTDTTAAPNDTSVVTAAVSAHPERSPHDSIARDSARVGHGHGRVAAPNARDTAAPPVPSELRHPWLRANGDSGAARELDSRSADERLQALTEEMQGHLQLGNRLTARGDLAGARRAYRDATEEGGIIKLTFGGPQVARKIDFILLSGMRQAFQACQLAHADSTSSAASADCGSLFAR
jgi:serine/threonine-protein kinase